MIPAVPSEKPATSKHISKRVKAAIEALTSGEAKTVTAAAEVAGLSREHLSRELGKPHVAEALRGKTLRNLAIAFARAGAVKTELLGSDNAMVRDRASSFVLGLAGITPQTAPAAPATATTPGVCIQRLARLPQAELEIVGKIVDQLLERRPQQ